MLRLLALLLILVGDLAVASQTPKADYRFEGNLESTVPGAPIAQHLTGSGPNGFVSDVVDGHIRQTLRFEFNGGLKIPNTNLIIPNESYTIVALIKFDDVYGYRRLADFKNGTSPTGAYIYWGRFDLEPNSAPALNNSAYFQAVIVRYASGLVRLYRDGVLRREITNDQGEYQIGPDNILRIAQDDFVSGPDASAGNIARLRLYDGTLSELSVRSLSRPGVTARLGQQLAFSTARNGFAEIYTMLPNGGDQSRTTRSITSPGRTDTLGDWSPNGRKLLFTRSTSGFGDAVYVKDSDGRNEVSLISDSQMHIRNPRWSPDGARITYSRCDSNSICDIFVCDSRGNNRINLTPNSLDDDHPSWSPDGTQIVFTRSAGYEIWIMNRDGSSPRRITNNAVDDFYPTWSPDGSTIAYVSRISTFNLEIYTVKTDGTGNTRITFTGATNYSPAWSPDGSRIVFASNLNSSTLEIYSIAPNGTDLRRLTTNSADDFAPRWRIPPFVPADFDGDAKSDISVFRPSSGEWWILRSADTSNYAFQFGSAADLPVSGDYTGDGKVDVAFWRPSNGNWYVLRSQDFTYYSFPFGVSGDLPVVADFDHDGLSDPAVFRPGQGVWFIAQSKEGLRVKQFGSDGDLPVAADYDGDGKCDVAIFRPSTGQWWIDRSSLGTIVQNFGTVGDRPLPGDYTGDGLADVAFFRPADGSWYVRRSENSTYFSFPFGIQTDIPAPADYDGDGKFDVAVFRPLSGIWYISLTSGSVVIEPFGAAGDRPVIASSGVGDPPLR